MEETALLSSKMISRCLILTILIHNKSKKNPLLQISLHVSANNVIIRRSCYKNILREAVLTVKEAALTVKQAAVTVKETVLTVKDTVLTVKQAVLTVKETVLKVKETVLTVKETVLTVKEAALSHNVATLIKGITNNIMACYYSNKRYEVYTIIHTHTHTHTQLQTMLLFKACYCFLYFLLTCRCYVTEASFALSSVFLCTFLQLFLMVALIGRNI